MRIRYCEYKNYRLKVQQIQKYISRLRINWLAIIEDPWNQRESDILWYITSVVYWNLKVLCTHQSQSQLSAFKDTLNMLWRSAGSVRVLVLAVCATLCICRSAQYSGFIERVTIQLTIMQEISHVLCSWNWPIMLHSSSYFNSSLNRKLKGC